MVTDVSAPTAGLALVGAAAIDIPTDGLRLLIVSCVIWTLGWILLFYFVRWIQPLWLKRLPKSSKAHEDNENWCARNVLGILHALFIAVIALPSFFALIDAPVEVKFAASPHFADCALDQSQVDAMPWNTPGRSVALVGLAFTTFTIADVFISVMYRLTILEPESCRGVDHLVHHAAFITVGLMIRSNCMLPYNAAILMSMEASTPFLNYCTLMMNRGKSYSCSTTVSGLIFFVVFMAIRIVLNTYGVIYLFMHSDIAMPAWVPESVCWFVLVAISAGAFVQYIWAVAVLRKCKEQWTTRDWPPLAQNRNEGARAVLGDARDPSAKAVPGSADSGSEESQANKQKGTRAPEEQVPTCFPTRCTIS